MEKHCAIDNETSTGALVVLSYKRCAKNSGIDGAFEHEQQYVTHSFLWHSNLTILIEDWVSMAFNERNQNKLTLIHNTPMHRHMLTVNPSGCVR